MQKLKCELCNSVDIVKIDNDMFQCQSCGCKYTLQQVKSLISGTVEVTIGDSERNRLIKNIEDKVQLGLSPRSEIAILIKVFPSDYHGYWFYLQNVFREVNHEKKLFSLWSQNVKEYYSCLLKILSNSANSELSIQNVEEFYKESFKKLYSDLIHGNISGLRELHFGDDWEIHPLIAEAHQMGYDNAKLLFQNNIHIRSKNTCYDKVRIDSLGFDLYDFATKGEKPSFVLGKDIYWNVSWDREYHGLLPDSLIPIDKHINDILQSLAAKPTICPICNTHLTKVFLSNKMKCPKCGSIY